MTLIQKEHLDVIAACLHRESLSPVLLRRNLAVPVINLLALKDKVFRVVEALLRFSGLCRPWIKMEIQLGAGGYNATRGHGGITARAFERGDVGIGDGVVRA